jgi:hypothetical protein
MLVLVAGLAAPLRAQDDPQAEYRQNLARSQSRMTSATVLAQKVHEIATSGGLSSDHKAKRISTAVRIAVVAATAYKTDPEEIMGIAVRLAQAAAQAAPRYADIIANAVAFTPAVARVSGAQSRIRMVTAAAARGPKAQRQSEMAAAAAGPAPDTDDGNPAPVAVVPPRARRAAPAPTPAPADEMAEAAPAPVAEPAPAPAAKAAPPDSPVSTDAAAPAEPTEMETPTAEDSETAPTAVSRTPANLSQGEGSKLTALATLGVQRDNNVYFSHADKTADTIFSLEPGLSYQYGQNAQNHGLISYQENFLRYVDHTAPNVDLANVNGNLAYSDGAINLTASGNYQQLFQNNIDELTIGPQALIRSDVYNLNANGEFEIGGKTSASIGVAYNHTTYGLASLLSSQDITFPVDVYYKLTPKVDVFAGYSFGVFKPLDGGPEAKDGYANIGARGDFTAKLSGSVSVGYITRTFDNNPSTVASSQTQSTHSLGFSGNLNYEFTPKTSASLSFNRSFNASALAQTTTYTTYTLALNTEITPQWSIGESLSEQLIDYGPQVFFVDNTLPTTNRRDNLLTANVHLTYTYSRWLNGTIGYTFRDDHSSISEIDFSDNVFSFTIGLSY